MYRRAGGAHIEYMASMLAKNGGKHFAGHGLTMADLCFFDILDNHMRIYEAQIKETVSHGSPHARARSVAAAALPRLASLGGGQAAPSRHG